MAESLAAAVRTLVQAWPGMEWDEVHTETTGDGAEGCGVFALGEEQAPGGDMRGNLLCRYRFGVRLRLLAPNRLERLYNEKTAESLRGWLAACERQGGMDLPGGCRFEGMDAQLAKPLPCPGGVAMNYEVRGTLTYWRPAAQGKAG